MIALRHDFISASIPAVGKLNILTGLGGKSLDGRKLTVDESASRVVSGTIEAVTAGYGIMNAVALYSSVAGMKSFNQQGNAEGTAGDKGGTNTITNDVLECPRTGSALKVDKIYTIKTKKSIWWKPARNMERIPCNSTITWF